MIASYVSDTQAKVIHHPDILQAEIKCNLHCYCIGMMSKHDSSLPHQNELAPANSHSMGSSGRHPRLEISTLQDHTPTQLFLHRQSLLGTAAFPAPICAPQSAWFYTNQDSALPMAASSISTASAGWFIEMVHHLNAYAHDQIYFAHV